MENKNLTLGFTLLEVLIAVMLLGLSMMILLQSQSGSIKMAQEAKNMTVATQLAKAKLLDCEELITKDGFSTSDFNLEGKFDEPDFNDFTWECHGYRFDMPMPDQDSISKGMKAAQKFQSAAPTMDMAFAVMAPFIQLVSNSLGDSIRELVVVVRWPTGNGYDDVKLTTHVINRMPLVQLTVGMGGGPGTSTEPKDSSSELSGPNSEKPKPTSPPLPNGSITSSGRDRSNPNIPPPFFGD